MGELIISVVMDVDGHVFIQHFKRTGVGWIASPTATRKFVVLDSSEFVVLNPEIGFEGFRRSREAKQGRIARRKTAAPFLPPLSRPRW
jgi:hypothetical protein